MDNSILVGKYIYKLLSEDEVLSGMVTPKKIFPLVANADTTYPFIVYSRSGLVVEYCKDGVVENSVDFQILSVSDSYVESLEVANQIRCVLELRRYKDDDIRITDIRLSSVQEEFMEDAYVQRLTFTIKTN